MKILGPAQERVMQALMAGYVTDRQIAQFLGISEPRVGQIFAHLGRRHEIDRNRFHIKVRLLYLAATEGMEVLSEQAA